MQLCQRRVLKRTQRQMCVDGAILFLLHVELLYLREHASSLYLILYNLNTVCHVITLYYILL